MQECLFTPATNITGDVMILTSGAVIFAGHAIKVAPPATFNATAAVKVTGEFTGSEC